MSDTKFLVTGVNGCIGSWVARQLTDLNIPFVATDVNANRARPALLLSEAELAEVNWQTLDVTDTQAVNKIVADNAITHIVHLAGLQIPFARANPPAGAAVNVLGTVNLLEATRQNNVRGIAYASSMAVFGPAIHYDEVPVRDDAPRLPDTLYGVYKVANEETARVYWQDWQVGSVGLRPGTVYGIGRDQGMTSDIAKALLATAIGREHHIRFDGPVILQYASDVAKIFIGSALAAHQGAAVCNLRNDAITVADFIAILKSVRPDAKVTCAENAALPFPPDFDDSNLKAILGTVPHTPLKEAILSDLATYAHLAERGAIDLGQLEG